MPSISIRLSDEIKLVLDTYMEVRTQLSTDFTRSTMVFESGSQQSWGAWLGLSYETGTLSGIEFPQPGGLSSRIESVMREQPLDEIKQNVQLFQDVYNICQQYIADNQTRYWGRANLTDVSHGKVVVMLLLAHLCEQAVGKTKDEQDIAKQRILKFTEYMLRQSSVCQTSSNDSQLISCKSSLDKIYTVMTRPKAVDAKEKMRDYYLSVRDSLSRVNELVTGVNNYLLPLISLQNQVDAKGLVSLFDESSALSSYQREVLENRTVQMMFNNAHQALKKPDGYLDVYNGLSYVFPEPSCFLLSKLSDDQRCHLIQLLQHRDRLQVLQAELDGVYRLAEQNATQYFSAFTKLSESYLKEMHRVKNALILGLEQFNADCVGVYAKRQTEANAERAKWEGFYLDKRPLGRVRERLVLATRQLNDTFSKQPVDYFESLQATEGEASQVIHRATQLFGEQFTEVDSTFQKAIASAQENELQRQADLILIKQKTVFAEYDELIRKISETHSTDPQRQVILETLQRRRDTVGRIIDELERPSSSSSEDDFVLIDEEDTQQSEGQGIFGFLPSVVSWLSSSHASLKDENQRLKVENAALQTALSRKEEETRQHTVLEQQHHREMLQRERTLRVVRESLDQQVQFSERQKDLIGLTCLNDETKRSIVTMELSQAIQHMPALLSTLRQFEKIINQSERYENAYCQNASRYDKSLFFSHNQRGQHHAHQVMQAWRNQFQHSINETIRGAVVKIGRNEDNALDEAIQAIKQSLVQSMNQLVASEQFSSYKQHSFRNYLYHFYNAIIKNGAVQSVSSVKDEGAIVNTLNASFNREDLIEFQRTVSTRV